MRGDPTTSATGRVGGAVTALLLAGSVALASGPDFPEPPSPDGARSVNLVEAGDQLLLSWTQPAGEQTSLVYSAFDGEDWSSPVEIVRGDRLLVNRADVPELAVAEDGTISAHWLEMIGDNAHAYGVRSARSTDGGKTWQALGWLHDDESAVEHGFVSHARAGDGRLSAFWLDGRAMPENGDTQLRVAALGSANPPASEVLDERVCECCSTDAAQTAQGPLIVYRDRSAEEIRDISVVRWSGDGWSEPATVHADGWRIEGCPVNGPAVSTEAGRVAVAWYTAADASPRVQVAFSDDSGRTFAPPIVVDGGRPRGQVDIATTDDGATVVWLRREGGATEVVWRQVGADGATGPVHRIGPAPEARISEYPKLGRIGDRVVAVWGETADASQLRVVQLETN